DKPVGSGRLYQCLYHTLRKRQMAQPVAGIFGGGSAQREGAGRETRGTNGPLLLVWRYAIVRLCAGVCRCADARSFYRVDQTRQSGKSAGEERSIRTE